MTIAEKNVLVAEYVNVLPMVTGAYHFLLFGYMTINGMWKDSFQPEQLKFHKDWNWLMFAVKYASKKNNTELLVNSAETIEEVFERIVHMIVTLKQYNYDN
jgi:hypothetical protein